MKARLILKYVGNYMSKYIYRRTYKTATRPSGGDGNVVLLDVYESSQRLGYRNSVKLI